MARQELLDHVSSVTLRKVGEVNLATVDVVELGFAVSVLGLLAKKVISCHEVIAIFGI